MSARIAFLALAPAGPKDFSEFVLTPAVQKLARDALCTKSPKGGRWLAAIYSTQNGTKLHLQVWPRHRHYPGVTLYADDLTIQIAIFHNGTFLEGGRIDVDAHDPACLILT